jgi:hypothetical protein
MVGAPPPLLRLKPLIASKHLAATEEMVSRLDGMLREGRSSWSLTCLFFMFMCGSCVLLSMSAVVGSSYFPSLERLLLLERRML